MTRGELRDSEHESGTIAFIFTIQATTKVVQDWFLYITMAQQSKCYRLSTDEKHLHIPLMLILNVARITLKAVTGSIWYPMLTKCSRIASFTAFTKPLQREFGLL